MSMPLSWPVADRVGTLRMRGETRGSLSLRLAMSAMLGRADLRPPGIPPAAVLIVRRLDDPLPRRLTARSAMHPIDDRWEGAARERLAELYRGAARPARSPVSPGANAVLFADEAEMLASLALDMVDGSMRERWWWRCLGGSLPPASHALAAVLRDRPAAVPAALTLLARARRAVEVVRALAPEEALVVLAAVLRVHGASGIVAEPASDASASMPEQDAGRSVRTDARAANGSAKSRALDPQDVAPPWSAWLERGAVPAELAPAQACLLGIARVLHAHPEAVRSRGFARVLRRWQQAQEKPRVAASPSSAHRSRRSQPAGEPNKRTSAELSGSFELAQADKASRELAQDPSASSDQLSVRRSGGMQARDSSARTGGKRAGRRHTTNMDSPHRRDGKPVEPSDARRRHLQAPPAVKAAIIRRQDTTKRVAATASESIVPGSRVAATSPDISRAPSQDEIAADAAVAITPSPAVVPPDDALHLQGGVDTDLAGVLFLINLMVALDLPACFEESWCLASRLGAWGVLDALARALTPSSDGLATDPLWSAFDALAGGADARPRRLVRPARCRLPATWPRLAEGEGEEAHAWAPLATLGPLARPLNPTLRRWLRLVVPYIRLRLARALAADATNEEFMSDLLRRRGRLYVTSTHVDLVMPLDAVSLAVRRAGLDRSPGWLPEFARVILFHFE